MPIAIAIHGGCGTLPRHEMTDAEWAEAKDHLADSLKAGWAILKAGGKALDAVEAAVVVMENSPHFNAGYGAALNTDGFHELDASIMDGRTLAAGAIAAATHTKNPIKVARAVMERSGSLLLTGPAADAFAEKSGLETVENGYFTTARRVETLARMKAREKAGTTASASEAEKHGTVGAVALDSHGDLAAATSTGGFTNKPAGRVGDSPIIGAGTYARNGVSATSCTGMGEFFIRHVAGHEVASLIRLSGLSLAEATARVIDEIAAHDIGAGLVAVGPDGAIAAPYRAEGMYRGWITTEGELAVATHAEIERRGRV